MRRRRSWLGKGVGIALACAALVIAWHRYSTKSHSTDRIDPPRSGIGRHSVAAAPRPETRGSVAGTIDDDGGHPLPRARVCIRAESDWLPSTFTHCTSTDANGAYAITGLYGADYTVSALADHHLPGRLERLALREGERRAGVDLVLRAGGVEITGTVSDLGGGPIAHAAVAAFPTTTYESSATVETDDAGAFRMWVAPGGVGVSADADGYTDDLAWGIAPGTFDLVLTPESALGGTVVDARTHLPVPDATVRLAPNAGGAMDRPPADRHTLTDDQGHFAFDRLGPGRYVATATAVHGYGRSDGSIAVGLAQHVDGLRVELQPATTVEGRVLIAGAPDKPCPDAVVSLWASQSDDNRTARATADGAVRIDGVLPGTYQVYVSCHGYVLPAEAPALAVGTRDLSGLSWRLVPEAPRATIRGHVRTVAGAAVPDAVVSSSGHTTTTTADGAYELGELEAGPHYIDVTSEVGVAPPQGWRVDVAAGAAITKDLTLAPGGSIAGTVTDADGQPAARIKVNVEYPESWNATTGQDGRFRFDSMRPAPYTIYVAERDGQYKRVHATVTAGQTTTIDVVIAAAPGIITGTVVDAGGAPIADAFVVAGREIDGYADTRPWSPHDSSRVLVGPDGSFTVPQLVLGSYTLRAYRTGGGEALVEHVQAGSHVRVQIEPTGSIAGTIHGPDGAPLDATVRVADAHTGLVREERCCGAGGRYHVDDLPAGTYQIVASASGVEGVTAVTLSEGSHRTGVDITLDASVTLVGRVVDFDSRRPLPDVRVSAGVPVVGTSHAGTTDQDGRFSVAGVPRARLILELTTRDQDNSAFFERSVTAAGTFDLGDLVLVKRRVERGDTAGSLGIEFEETSMRVLVIRAGSPAASSSLAIGDVITMIDGIDVTPMEGGAAQMLLAAPPGTTFKLGRAVGPSVILTSIAAAP